MDQDRHHPQLLDRYLDGLLDAGDRLAFERTLADRPDLARQVETQHAVDAALVRTLRVPPASGLRPIAERAIAATADRAARDAQGRHRLPFTGAPLRVAAAIVLLVAGSLMTWNATRPARRGSGYGPLPRMTLVEVYAAELDAGFRPRVVCRDAAEFSLWFEDRFDQGLALDPPEDRTALGLGYSNSITPKSIHVLAAADNARILLFVDRADRDRRGAPAGTDELHVFRREVGALVVYELTPLDEARFLPHFRVP